MTRTELIETIIDIGIDVGNEEELTDKELREVLDEYETLQHEASFYSW